MLLARLVEEVDKDFLNVGIIWRVLSPNTKLFYTGMVILLIDVMKNIFDLILESMEYVTKSFI